MNTVQILDKKFKLSIPSADINLKTREMADLINANLKGKDIVFVVVLNGAFMFAGDLLRYVHLPNHITFIKLASYAGTSTSGTVKQLIGLNEDIENKTVVIVEDIIDTGHTLDAIFGLLQGFSPAEIKIATLLHKPGCYRFNYKIDYLGFSIPNNFVVGYGLDYNCYGRNLNDIYVLEENL
ncbi:MAG: hypoxanthine phosphoribosyltransferase [Bacteroidales bacterium]|nr:hypoxanthine phosphoribosyltransferase [Bacteroidales bacterium]